MLCSAVIYITMMLRLAVLHYSDVAHCSIVRWICRKVIDISPSKRLFGDYKDYAIPQVMNKFVKVKREASQRK